MEIIVMIIMFLVISSGGVLGAVFLQKKYEETLPLMQCILIMILFWGGMANLLKESVWIVCSLTIMGYGICIFWIIKNKSIDRIKKNIFTNCFWVFLIVYLLIWVCNIGMVPHYYDEYTCWGTRVKDMCRLDMMYTSEHARSWGQPYPPATALIQYFYEKIQYMIVGENKFVEWYLFVAYQVFMVSFLMPLLGRVQLKRKKYDFIFIAVFVLTLPMIFYTYAYDTIMVDPLLGVMLGYCFFLLVNKKGTLFELVAFTFCQITLALTKDVVVFFNFMMWLYWIIDDIAKRSHEQKKSFRKNIICDLMGISFFLFIRFIWNQHLTGVQLLAEGSGGLVSDYSKRISVGTFIAAVTGMVRDQSQIGFINYCRAFFSSEYLNISNFNLGVSYFACLVLFLIISVYLCQYYKSNSERKRRKYLLIGEYITLIGYLGAVLLSYMFVMEEFAARTLNCFDRYLSMAFLMVAYTLVAEWIELKWNENANWPLHLLLSLCLIIPGRPLIQFLDRQNVYDSWSETDYINDINKIEQVIGYDVNENHKGLDESEITLGCLDLGTDYLGYQKIFRYGLNTNWNVIGVSENVLTTEKDRDKLEQYDYILIYYNTNRLRQKIGAEVESAGNEVFDLYRVQNKKVIRIL